jgi:beta-alanine degradation protein BauB
MEEAGRMDTSEDLGTKLMLENDRVRIWEHRVPAGATGPMHLHRRPYLSVVVLGSSGDTLEADGNALEHFTFEPGNALWVGPEALPETHALRNTGEDEILIVTTELL